jgi:prepilin-type N-terminal cleavage/methylation domain-containing protein
MPARRGSTIRSRGFSIIELVMVIGILGFVSAIAIPRVSAAAETARASTLAETQARLQRACDLFSADHFELSIAEKTDGSLVTDSSLASRLLVATNAAGDAAGVYGPYMASIPLNPYNGLNTIRITSSSVRNGTAGWMYVTSTRTVLPDHDPMALPASISGGKLGPVDASASISAGEPTE